MNIKRELRVLEFDKIREKLAAFSVTPLGASLCLRLLPEDDFNQVKHALEETQEAVVMCAHTGGNPIHSFDDVTDELQLAKKGAMLSPRSLLHIANCMAAARAARALLQKDTQRTPILSSLSSLITVNQGLEQEITDAIIGEEEIADRASAELMQIRKKIRVVNDRVREKLNSIVHGSSHAKYLQEAIITMRNGRYCVPVKAEYRSNMPGLVHDQSSTGATLFVEPLSVVELGNDLKQLQAQEQKEIARILQALTDQVGTVADELSDNIGFLARIDFAFAKAVFANEMDAVMPEINHEGYMDIVRGRHPLLDPKTVVPCNIHIGREFTTLIITGPNTGGKTVTLKTVGLFTLMMQAGLHVPAEQGTRLAVFDHVYADIGDEQSIEQSLSTFSGHMTNIVEILGQVEANDLALFDELGAGTDPTEGAALAQTILSYLLSRSIRTMATTHYSELKAFALTTTGVENASVEFDIETLRPTYRLSIGIPGKSNAFEISQKLGLSKALIEDAKTLLSKNDIRFEDVIANAEYHRNIAEKERVIAEKTRQETIRLRDEAEALRNEIEEKKRTNIRRSKDDAKRILENARSEAEAILSDVKQMRKDASSPDAEAIAIRKRLNDGIDKLSEELSQKSTSMHKAPKTVRVGEHVEIVHLNTKGTVLTPPNGKGEVEIQAGILKMKVHISQLRLLEPKKENKTTVTAKTGALTRNVPLEIDVRGQAIDEALPEIDRYLDEAMLAGLHEVSIIHGKGTGVLRAGVQKHLKKHMNVKSYRLGIYGEGEDGVTVVTLK
ncbi:MAG TPA: endonuclease MutS2 [Candidatus Limiplasma sp.]|nr:endonuclease MutS2 [Candidatus Limiplasma sp.]